MTFPKPRRETRTPLNPTTGSTTLGECSQMDPETPRTTAPRNSSSGRTSSYDPRFPRGPVCHDSSEHWQ